MKANALLEIKNFEKVLKEGQDIQNSLQKLSN